MKKSAVRTTSFMPPKSRKTWTAARIRKKSSAWTVKLLRAILLIGLSFVILYPLLIKITLSFMTVEDVYDLSVRYIPNHFTTLNYQRVWEFLDMGSMVWNSFRIPLISALLNVMSATLVAYGLARHDFPGKKLVFAAVIIGLVIPPDLLLLPQYMQFRFFDFLGFSRLLGLGTVNLLNTDFPFYLLAATCTGLRNGIYIFLMVQYFRGLPKEIEEVAYVDGAGTMKTLVYVFLPSARQIMIPVFLFSFVWQWLDDIYTSTFAQDMSLLSTSITQLVSGYSVEMGVTNVTEFSLMRNAGILLLIIPPLLIYVFFQRYFTESIARSGLVG